MLHFWMMIQESEVDFFRRKSEVFQAFQRYLARNERGDLRNHRFRTDRGEGV